MIKVLDGLRGYAALMIVLAHSPLVDNFIFFKSLNTITSKAGLGYLGVDIFFVLSGFLITRILIREKSQSNFSFKRFYIKRSLRIFPIYYLTVLVTSIVFTWDGIFYTSTYLSNFYFSFEYLDPHPLKHTWSLAIEEHYYFLWPLIIYYFPLKKIKKYYMPLLLISIIITLLCTFYFFNTINANYLVQKATNFRILTISAGSILAFYEKKIFNSFNKKNVVKIFFVFLSFYFLATIRRNTFIIDILPESVILLFMYAITSVSLFLLVLSLENKKGVFNMFFTNKTIVFIGKISYGIYLFHYPIFYYFTDEQSNLGGISIYNYIYAMVLTILLPIISYLLIEKPLIKVKNRLIQN